MNLIEYMPPFLKNIREYKEIFDAEDIELEKLRTQMEKILEEVIVSTAKDYGLDRYEKIYDIENNTTDLEMRRFNILSKINNKLPYSLNWLKNKLNNIIGKDNYTLYIDYNNYTIEINVIAIFKDIAEILNRDLREQLPANLKVTVKLFQTEECKQYVAGIVHVGDFIELRQVT